MAINKLTISGNLGKDAELFTTQAGMAILTFNIPAVSGFGDKEKVSWITCKVFGKRAEAIESMLKKGTKCVVEGQYSEEEWEKDGVKQRKSVLLISEIDIMSNKQSSKQEPVESAEIDYNDFSDSDDSSDSNVFKTDDVKSDNIVKDVDDDIPF